MNQLPFLNKTILITGGAGAIGRNLAKQIAQQGAKKVIILDNLSSSYAWNLPTLENILFIKGDIRSENDLMHVFHHKPQIVFHLAAFFANQNSVDYPFVNNEVNVQALIRVLEYSCLSNTVERFVFSNSEGGVYGDGNTMPFSEDQMSLDLGSPYYISKMSGEAYCRYYHKQYDLPVSIARLFNSYGPGEVPGQYRNVIPNFIFWALKGQTLPLTGTKEIGRDFVYVGDTANALMTLGHHPASIGEAINVASGMSTSIHDLAQMINDKTKNSGGVKILKQRKWDRKPSILGDTSKAKRLIGFEAKTTFEEGIDMTVDWFRSNWSEIEQSAEFNSGLNPALDV